MMIDVFLVKNINDEPFYNPGKDLSFGNIQDAWNYVLGISKECSVKPSKYYIVRIEFTNKEDIIKSIQFSADGIMNYIKNYTILNTISITCEN